MLPFYPYVIVNASRVFYAFTDMESGSERKAKDREVTKKIARYIA